MTDYFSKSKIAVFSDLHIGVHQNSKYWHNVARCWAQWIIAELKHQNIKDIVFGGDFFHTRNEVSVDTLHFGSELLEMFADFQITMITGNHDCYLKDSSSINSLTPFKHWNNINVVDKYQRVESHGRSFGFVPWGESINNIQSSNIIFGHFEINRFKMNTFFVCDHGVDANSLLSLSPLIISGHFHLRDERRIGDGVVLYVGNPFQMDFNDASTSKGYYILDVTDSTYVFHENKISPRHHNITLSSLVKHGVIDDHVVNMVTNNLVKLRIDRRISPDDLDVLITRLRQLCPQQFNVEHQSGVDEFEVSEQRKDLSGINIEAAIREFVDLMDINNREEVIGYTIEVLNRVNQ